MRTIIAIIVCVVSLLISALILYPCLFLSVLSGFKVDYHYKFHLWWGKEVLDKL